MRDHKMSEKWFQIVNFLKIAKRPTAIGFHEYFVPRFPKSMLQEFLRLESTDFI